MVLFSDLTIGQIFAVFGYLWFMFTPVQEFLGIQFSWYSAKAALKRINSFLALEEEKRTGGKVAPFGMSNSVDVDIKDVTFAYNDEKTVLNELSIQILAGKKVALVGASGGGKSTLIQLFIGVYRASSGQISFNGHSSDDIGFELIRKQIAVVLQQPILKPSQDARFRALSSGSVQGKERSVYPSDQELWKALEVAQLQDVTEQLTDGLDTQIGRQGVRLSGGQRQRLAIARMVLSDPNSLFWMKPRRRWIQRQSLLCILL
jgi:ATP-binding cassette subfamily B protein/ATP-binding cassette subfamily C protein